MDIDTVKAFIRGKEQMPILHVKDSDDPDYKSMRKLIMDINPNTEDYMHNISAKMNKLMSTLRHMEPNDYNKIVNTFKKYNTDDMNGGGVSGKRMYGYDRSRVDGKYIRRRRVNWCQVLYILCLRIHKGADANSSLTDITVITVLNIERINND